MVNKEKIDQLIAFIEAGTIPWSIKDHRTCFIGQAEACFNIDRDVGGELGIVEQSEFFMPHGYHLQDADRLYPRERAIAQLKYIRDNGEVNWSATPIPA